VNPPDDTSHTLGYHAAKIENIEAQVEDLGARFGVMDGKIDRLLAGENQRLGGFKALSAVGVGGGAVGAGLFKLWAAMKGHSVG
jgi:hypothetical protein